MIQQNWLNLPRPARIRLEREVPAGAEFLIALPLGMAGWWGIVRAVLWLAA